MYQEPPFLKGHQDPSYQEVFQDCPFQGPQNFPGLEDPNPEKNQEIDHELNPKLFQGIDNDNDNGLIMIHILN